MTSQREAFPLQVRVKRAYEAPTLEDGMRVLVDRLWPRGLKKEHAQVHRWMRELAPSTELRQWFSHDPARWNEFRTRYLQELRSPERQALLKEMAALARRGPLTLLFGARDMQQNNAVVLREALEEFFRLRTEEGLARFDTLLYIVGRLRSPQGGCPWDRAQTHQSLGKYLLEESYEALDAIDALEPVNLREELGDVLLQIALHAQLASEEGHFTMADVLQTLNAKLARRHPHVFGDATAATPQEVEEKWAVIKGQEKPDRKQQQEPLVDGIPRHLPALAYSQQVQERAAQTGFEWRDVEGVWDKVREEMAELRKAATTEAQEHELGDALAALVNIARWLDLDAETALRKANHRFAERFATMQRLARQRGLEFSSLSLEQMDQLWEEAKDLLSSGGP